MKPPIIKRLEEIEKKIESYPHDMTYEFEKQGILFFAEELEKIIEPTGFVVEKYMEIKQLLKQIKDKKDT